MPMKGFVDDLDSSLARHGNMDSDLSIISLDPLIQFNCKSSHMISGCFMDGDLVSLDLQLFSFYVTHIYQSHKV